MQDSAVLEPSLHCFAPKGCWVLGLSFVHCVLETPMARCEGLPCLGNDASSHFTF